MVAQRLATLLPTMRLADAREITRIPRVTGLTSRHPAVVTMRPFRPPPTTLSPR